MEQAARAGLYTPDFAIQVTTEPAHPVCLLPSPVSIDVAAITAGESMRC